MGGGELSFLFDYYLTFPWDQEHGVVGFHWRQIWFVGKLFCFSLHALIFIGRTLDEWRSVELHGLEREGPGR